MQSVRTQTRASKCMSGLQALIFCELQWFEQSPFALKREKNSGSISLFMKAMIPGTHSLIRGILWCTQSSLIYWQINIKCDTVVTISAFQGTQESLQLRTTALHMLSLPLSNIPESQAFPFHFKSCKSEIMSLLTVNMTVVNKDLF